eukprot:g67651.t1
MCRCSRLQVLWRARCKHYPLLVYLLTTFCLFADQNILAPHLSAAAKEFGFGEVQRDKKLGGELALAFFVVGAPVSLLVGHFADSVNRTRLFALVVFLGEGSCGATYWTTTYRGLFICRMLTGISIGAALPLVFSLTGDLYPASQRTLVASAVSISGGLGGASGQFLSGFTGAKNWRLPFLLVAVPSLGCVGLLLFAIREPVRGGAEEVLKQSGRRGAGPTLPANRCQQFKELLRTPSVLLVLLQGLPGCIPWSIAAVFFNDYLSYDAGLTVAAATFVILLFGVGTMVGAVWGGWYGQRVYNRRKRLQPLLMAMTTAIGVLPCALLIKMASPDAMLLSCVLALIGGFITVVTSVNIRPILQNVTLPQQRGLAFSFFNVSDDLGRGLGPFFVSKMVVALGGRERTFIIGFCAWFLCAFFLAGLYFTVEADERSIQARLTRMAEEMGDLHGEGHRDYMTELHGDREGDQLMLDASGRGDRTGDQAQEQSTHDMVEMSVFQRELDEAMGELLVESHRSEDVETHPVNFVGTVR